MPNCTSFLDVNKQYKEKNALVFPEEKREISFVELYTSVSEVSGGLTGLGIKKGDRVCIYLDNTCEFLIAYFAIWRIGAVAVPVNRVLREGEVSYYINNSGAIAIITDHNGAGTMGTISGLIPGIRHVIEVSDQGKWQGLKVDKIRYRPKNCEFDTLCQIQYTSGTTGNPKGAMLTHGNWIASMYAEGEALSLVKDDVYLGIYPMAHVGVSWGVASLRAGATWIIMKRFELDKYLELAEEYGATVIAGMPPVIHTLTDSTAFEGEILSHGRIMISGGGPLHPAVWKEFNERFGIPVVNAYGLSETVVLGTGTAIRPDHYSYAEEYMSVGTPIGFSEVKIVDVSDPGRELPRNETGEIALRGPGVATGYWNMPEETASSFLPNGWFLTGDIGFLHEDGMLSITDRKKDMIVMSGWKIYPTEVEAVLIEHPGIRDVAIFGCDDIHRGEVPCAVLVPEAGTELSGEEIISYAKQKMAGYKVPRKIFFAKELPRVSGWKLLRKDLKAMYCKIQNEDLS